MTPKDKILQIQNEIDQIDKRLIEQFLHRMQLCDQIADVKSQGNLALDNRAREQQITDSLLCTETVPNEEKFCAVAFMKNVVALSKLRQREKLLSSGGNLYFPKPVSPKTEDVRVGFQGVIGAWSEIGARQLFPESTLEPFEYFENVFEAVKSKKIDYGIVPIENSQTGAIGEVYDLLRRQSCYIVKQVWVDVAHCMMGISGADIHEIRSVYSHPEGFRQCHRFLKNKHWEQNATRNTAVAAQLVAETKDKRNAAIGSKRAAEIYGLSILAESIADNPNNRTRFIVIADSPQYNETSKTISITFSTVHRCGALCDVMQIFMLAGINLSRIESRPVSADKYRFFADLQANVMDADTFAALKKASVECEYFEILGCY